MKKIIEIDKDILDLGTRYVGIGTILRLASELFGLINWRENMSIKAIIKND